MSTQHREPEALNAVKKFHTLFDAYIWDAPHMPAKNICDLRINLLQEELDEFKQAIADGDLVEAADALADMQYVLSGAILSFGMQDIFADLFDEVQRSNMSKACNTMEEAKATQTKYLKLDQPSSIVQKWEKFLVIRDEDQKILKWILKV